MRRPIIIDVEDAQVIQELPTKKLGMNVFEFGTRALQMAGSITFLVVWLIGIVLAKGFWSTLFSIFFPPWGWYLVVERLLIVNGWLLT